MAKLTYKGPYNADAKDGTGKTVKNHPVHRHEVYRGTDPATGVVIVAAAGDTVEVSDAKATQLLRDFPDAWAKKT